MDKTKRRGSVFKRCKRLKKECTAKTDADRISQLSDTTLARILSSLNLKEAARCSVLSTRWTGLWKQITRLDFDESKALMHFHNTSEDLSLLKPSRSYYLTWVNQVLTLHEPPTLDEFRVQFDLSAKARKDIDQWIKFAISKRVKKLYIDLTSYSGEKRYDISPEFFHYLKSPANLSDLKHLTSLSLVDVNITGELVEYFLSSCTHLERLDIAYSDHLVKLKVVGPSLMLKYLRIQTCRSLESVELSAPKLTTFRHHGIKQPVFLIGNNPLLTNLFFGGLRAQVAYALDAFSNLVGQLETLEFSIRMKVERETFKVAEFTNLRQLTLEVVVNANCLMPFADMIFAAPSLEKFTLQLRSVNCAMVKDWRPAANQRIERHECLEEIEVYGFHGSYLVMELLDFLFLNTVRLKKVVIDPYEPYVRRHFEAFGRVECENEEIIENLFSKKEEEIIKNSLRVAKELKTTTLPRGVRLVVME